MSDFRYNALAALAAVTAAVACSAAYSDTQTLEERTAGLPYVDGSEGLLCDVTAEPTSRGLLIEAHAFANRAVDGEYDLRITKRGGGGESDVSQGGFVAIAAGSEETLGQTELSVERGSRIYADLVVRDARGELCSQTIKLR